MITEDEVKRRTVLYSKAIVKRLSVLDLLNLFNSTNISLEYRMIVRKQLRKRGIWK